MTRASTSGPLNLGALELEVLQVLWREGASDVRAAHLAIGRSREVHANTVQSALERLFRKGLLSRAKQSHAFLYEARVSREQLAARLVQDALGRVGGAEPSSVLAAFVDLAAPEDPELLDRLEQSLRLRRGLEGPAS
jgi:predicted transcriptional regulator